MKEIMGNNLRRIRNNHSLAQPDLADILGITRNRVSAMENGRETVSLKTIELLCNRLNLDPIEFFYRDTISHLNGATDVKEKVLSDIYHFLDDKYRDKLIAYANDLKKASINVIRIKSKKQNG